MWPRLRYTALLCVAFFASGAAALGFEALWFHQAGLAFGHSVTASALVLSAFMAGMATGNAAAARVGDRLAHPLRWYALLEVLIAASGIGLVHLLPELVNTLSGLTVAMADTPSSLGAARLGSAWLLLLVPSAAMGMTLPLVLKALVGRDPRFGHALGLLYGANTLGAVAGVLLLELVWLRPLGIRQSALACGGLCALAAVIALGLSMRSRKAPDPSETAAAADRAAAPAAAPRPQAQGDAPWLPPTLILLGAFLAGFAMLALEVVWLRLLMLFITDTPVAFAVVLACVLAGIALGGLVGSAWLARSPDAFRRSDLVAYAATALGLISLHAYPHILTALFRFEPGPVGVATLSAPLVLPTAIASGLLFILLGAGLRRSQRGDAQAGGRLVFANTLGGALGSPMGGLLLVPALGMEGSLILLLGLFALAGIALSIGSGRLVQGSALAAAATLALLVMYPLGTVEKRYVQGSVSRWMSSEDRVVKVVEDATATLIHVRHREFDQDIFDQLAVNSYSMAVNDFAARRYMNLFAYLPLALHPKMDKALLVGFGVGNTAATLTATPEFSRIDIADISAATLEMSRGMRFRGPHPLDDPRVAVHIEDGRHFLEGTQERYDLITGEPPPPVLAGVSNLYSREYFGLIRDRLNDGGFATYWLPMMDITAPTARSIIAAFCDAFLDCSLWHASGENFMLMGSRQARTQVSVARFTARFGPANTREELRAVGFEQPAQLATLFIGDAEYLVDLVAHDPPVSDDYPRRMDRPGKPEARDDLIAAWRDTKEATKRFKDSAWVEAMFPKFIRRIASHSFDDQRLLNDLLFPGLTNARRAPVLSQVLLHARSTLPVLLMMRSDPDIQRALREGGEALRRDPRVQLHLAAGYLANREIDRALAILNKIPDKLHPMPKLVDAVALVRRSVLNP
ncbi:MAG: fused MFS/spermidine synthase [Myxococcales bacterium]|nr:fused MFS/spermidine synthase [Myxococcales bacterium]MDD9965362.1 fused MFS/spermidine synthase [Myxococcales bacterium]